MSNIVLESVHAQEGPVMILLDWLMDLNVDEVNTNPSFYAYM